jgi:hypothetical protein
VRHFAILAVAILAVMTLTACALPGALGTNGFMSSMHPTPEFCASRGLTLDPTTKQCVTASQSAPTAAEVTGSLPQGAQPPAQSSSAPSAAPPATSAAPVATTSAPPPVATAAAPMAAPVQPPPRERSAADAAPIEPDAVIYAELRGDVGLMSELTHYVRASGYRCDSISALAPLAYGHGFKFVCNHFNYKYAIEEKNGRSTVTVLDPAF